MSGTNHNKLRKMPGPQPVFVLVEPQMGENIGAAARAMWNFSLENLRIVAPRDGWPNPKAVATSSGAGQVMDQVQVSDTLEAAIGDLNYIYATTARNRDLTSRILTPEAAMQEAAERISTGQKVGMLFGPERAGLSNEDLVKANALISVPVNPAFGSLNLAQCVLLVAYEWQRQKASIAEETNLPGKTRPAHAIEVEKLSETLTQRLETTGFFWPEHKADSMALNLRNMLSRMELTDADVRTLHGVIRSLADKHPKSR